MGNLRPTMTPDEVPTPAGGSTNPLKPRRRSRRGGRGRRRPGPRPAGEVSPASPPMDEPGESLSDAGREPSGEEIPPPDSAHEAARHEAGDSGHFEEREPSEEQAADEPTPRDEIEELPSRPPRPERRDFQPASPAAVTEAIEAVSRVITSLQQSLATMEEILETLELAEVQKTGDEREIQSLRNALRQFDRSGPEPRREPRESRDLRDQPPRRSEQRRGGRR